MSTTEGDPRSGSVLPEESPSGVWRCTLRVTRLDELGKRCAAVIVHRTATRAWLYRNGRGPYHGIERPGRTPSSLCLRGRSDGQQRRVRPPRTGYEPSEQDRVRRVRRIA